MGRIKITGKPNAVTDWKVKSIQRSREIKALNKRIRELTASRDLWKSKYIASKKQADTWEDELVKLKKKLNEIINH